MGKKTPKSSPKKQQGSAGPSSPKLQQPANKQGAPSKTQAKVPTPTTNQQPTQQQTTPTKQPVPAQQEMVSNQVQSTPNTDSRTAEQNTVSMQEKCIASQNVPAVELDDVPLPGAGSEKVRKCKDKLMEKLEAICYISEYEKAIATFNLMEAAMATMDWKNPQNSINFIMNICSEIDMKNPHETTPKNVIHRLRKLIIDEYLIAARIQPTLYLAHQFISSLTERNTISVEMPPLPPHTHVGETAQRLREGVMGALMEYKMELENIPSVFGSYGCKLIYHYDRVLTFSFCPVLAQLFREASRKCRFTLLVVETAPMGYGHLMVDALRGCPIDVVLLPNADFIFHLNHVTKVILPSNSVSFSGVKTTVFGAVIGLLASRRHKEIYVVAPSYHFSMSHSRKDNVSLSPYLINEGLGSSKAAYCLDKYDVIERGQITNLMTNSGCITPGQTEKYLADLYAPKHEET